MSEYYRADIAYAGFFSSNGIITTSTGGEIINLVNGAGDPITAGTIAIEFITNCNISFDGTTNYHSFNADDKIDLQRVAFTQLRVETSSTQLRFFGLYI